MSDTKKTVQTTRIILVRHGESIANIKKVVCGTWESALTATGMTQAKKLAVRLKDEHIDIIYSSRLSRAYKTATAIHHYHPAVPLIVEPELHERHYGIFERKKISTFYAAMHHAGKTRATFRPEKGESVSDVRKRAKNILKKIISENSGKTILIVSHGAFNTAALLSLLKKKNNTSYVALFQHNTAVSIVDITGTGTRLHTLNCTKHLK